MTELYGSAFLAGYGDSPSPLWVAAIGGLSDEECRAGLTSLARQPREYPANLTQFVAACKPNVSPRFLGVPVTPEDLRKALPPPEKQAKHDVIDGWLAKMRKRVGGGVTEKTKQSDSADILEGACTCRSMGTCEVCRRFSAAPAASP